jgi:cell division protein FtsI/penicillin-binding protein 2
LPPEEESPNSIGRRRFLKSLFGLGATVSERAEAKPKFADFTCVLWADLKTGFVGFPSGLKVPHGTPGSVMKLIGAAALLEGHHIDPSHKYDCHGRATIYGETVHCQFAHGHVDMTQALAVSCNSYFAHASEHLSTDEFLKTAKLMGLSSPMAQYASGPFPDKSGDPSYTFLLGLNPAMQPSALQLLRLAALIAANGTIPYLHSADDLESGEPMHVQLASSTWHILHQGMEQAAKHGTAKLLDPENLLHVAAKTGTSPHGAKFQSCIIGFFPYQNPRHIFCAWTAVGTSQETAIPEARKLLFSTEWE